MDQELNIEQLFSKKFEHFEVKASEEDWIKLNSKLSRSNFLKFSIVTFNIYWLLALLAFAGTAIYSGVYNHKMTKKVKQLEQTIQTYQKDMDGENTVAPVGPEKKEAILIERPHQTNNQKTPALHASPSNLVKAPIQMLQPSSRVDSSININEEPLQTDSSSYHRKTKVVKNIVVKKSSVIVKDTMVIVRTIK